MFERFAAGIQRPDISTLHGTLPDGAISRTEWDEAEQAVDDYLTSHFDPEPVTPFTDPWLQSSYNYYLHVAETLIAETPWQLPYRARIATLPSGDFNARTRKIAGTDEAAVMFDHTLLSFVQEYALIVAADIPDDWWGIPWPENLANREVGADTECAAEYFADLLVSYVLHGTTEAVVRPQLTWRTRVIASMIAAPMRLFLVCHELSHLLLGHLNAPTRNLSPGEWQHREYAADQVGSSLVAGTEPQERQVISLWITDLALAGFQYVERGLWYMTTGLQQELPASSSHPMPQWRRKRLLEENTTMLWESGRCAESNQLGHLTINGMGRLENLWLAAETRFLTLHNQGAQPAPLWLPRMPAKE
ncbi:hypothetical protein ACWCOV_24595 [Kribbella sp. NPDC002412]